MHIKSPYILLIDDDLDDKDIFESVIHELEPGFQLVWKKDGPEAMNFLQTEPNSPFLIFCDMNLPLESGLDFKANIDKHPELRRKSIPFLFYSTSADRKSVFKAYDQLTVQGFFIKDSGYEKMKDTLACILSYWKKCIHPKTL